MDSRSRLSFCGPVSLWAEGRAVNPRPDGVPFGNFTDCPTNSPHNKTAQHVTKLVGNVRASSALGNLEGAGR